MDHDLSLATPTCSRTLCADGTLLEVVDLDGIRGDLSDEALDQFVSGFPVNILQRASEMKAVFRRLRRIEAQLATKANAVSQRAVEMVWQRSRRRAEASGESYVETPLSTASHHRDGASQWPRRSTVIANYARAGGNPHRNSQR
jgi:hypothetical protein